MIAKLTTTAALLAIASPAFAATVIGDSNGAPDPGPPPGLTIVADFATPLATGVTNSTTGSVVTVSGSLAGQYAQPAPLAPPNAYQAVQGGGSSTFDFSGYLNPGVTLGKFSFYWGSIDTYNTISFLRADNSVAASFTGAAFPPANGNQPANVTNRRITFGFTHADAVTKVRMTSSQNAFEFDTLAVAGVPEPATWAMMILGFGLVGGAMRSRKAATTKLAYA